MRAETAKLGDAIGAFVLPADAAQATMQAVPATASAPAARPPRRAPALPLGSPRKPATEVEWDEF